MIEKILGQILAVLPRYGGTLWALLAHPVEEVAGRSRDGRLVWDAVLFWSVSVGIFLITRYIAFSPAANPVFFFVASGVSFLLQLLLVSGAFFVVWRLFGAKYQIGSFIIATACIHGVVLPFNAVLGIGSFGAARIINEDLFRQMVNSFNGCGQVITRQAMEASVAAGIGGAHVEGLGLIGLYILLTLPLLGVLLTYAIAYFRVLAQLAEDAAPFGLARVLLMLVLGSALAFAGLSFNALFDWTLFHDAALCMPVGG